VITVCSQTSNSDDDRLEVILNEVIKEGHDFSTKQVDEFTSNDRRKYYMNFLRYIERIQDNNYLFDFVINGVENSLSTILNTLGFTTNSVIQLRTLTGAIKPWNHRLSSHMLDFAIQWINNRLSATKDQEKALLLAIKEDLSNARISIANIPNIFLNIITNIYELTDDFLDRKGINEEAVIRHQQCILEQEREEDENKKPICSQKEMLRSVYRKIEEKILSEMELLTQIITDQTFINRTNQAIIKAKKLVNFGSFGTLYSLIYSFSGKNLL